MADNYICSYCEHKSESYEEFKKHATGPCKEFLCELDEVFTDLDEYAISNMLKYLDIEDFKKVRSIVLKAFVKKNPPPKINQNILYARRDEQEIHIYKPKDNEKLYWDHDDEEYCWDPYAIGSGDPFKEFYPATKEDIEEYIEKELLSLCNSKNKEEANYYKSQVVYLKKNIENLSK